MFTDALQPIYLSYLTKKNRQIFSVCKCAKLVKGIACLQSPAAVNTVQV